MTSMRQPQMVYLMDHSGRHFAPNLLLMLLLTAIFLDTAFTMEEGKIDITDNCFSILETDHVCDWSQEAMHTICQAVSAVIAAMEEEVHQSVFSWDVLKRGTATKLDESH